MIIDHFFMYLLFLILIINLMIEKQIRFTFDLKIIEVEEIKFLLIDQKIKILILFKMKFEKN